MGANPSEQEIQKSILDWLRMNGVFCWKQFGGGYFDQRRQRYIPTGVRGVPDILGILPGGVFLGCEVKRPGQKPTDDQLAFLRAITDAGGIGTWVTGIEELERDLEPYLKSIQPRMV